MHTVVRNAIFLTKNRNFDQVHCMGRKLTYNTVSYNNSITLFYYSFIYFNGKQNYIFHNGYNLYLYISTNNCTIYNVTKYYKNMILVMLNQ